jgi:hypothetical protein
MANGHTVIPLDGSDTAIQCIEYLNNSRMIFVPVNLPSGRFPTLTELRQAINDLGYTIDERQDWYVSSADDHTEIWFSDGTSDWYRTTSFWFRRGWLIVLNIMQRLANQCGSFMVADHSGASTIVIVPDSVVGIDSIAQSPGDYVSVIVHRMPEMIARLTGESIEDTLFCLSQIRQALEALDYTRPEKLFQSAAQGIAVYAGLSAHADVRVRTLAFELVATFRERFYEYSDTLRAAIKNEVEPHTKAGMMWTIEKLISGGVFSGGIDRHRSALLNLLLETVNDTGAPPEVRFAAACLLARSLPGFLIPAMREIFMDALIQPEKYKGSWYSEYPVSEAALETIKKLVLSHRIEILRSALPKITFAQDAHDVLRALLDYVFFGEIRMLWMSSLTEANEAERPAVDERRFRPHSSRNRLYPANLTRLTAAELMPFQRQVLEQVMTLEIPWMVHSNLLEKYGLPATRSGVRALLNDTP